MNIRRNLKLSKELWTRKSSSNFLTFQRVWNWHWCKQVSARGSNCTRWQAYSFLWQKSSRFSNKICCYRKSQTLKEFRSILLGQKIVVHTDYKNLTYAKFNANRVIRWRLIIEEYEPDLKYIKGSKNVVADALSRVNLKINTEFHSHWNSSTSTKKKLMQYKMIYPVRVCL